ncbi:MAG: hypothetical protein U0M92_06125 [Bacilli bacterium]
MMEESFIDIVNSLERATDTIYQAYELLYELEVDGEKNTSMYGITLNLLHKAIWVESDVLSRLNKTFMVEDALIYFSEKFNREVAFIINASPKKEDVPKIRIMNNLYFKLLENKKPDEHCLISASIFKLNVFVDYLQLALSIVQENENENVKNDLLRMKYVLSMSNSKLENILIRRGFDLEMHPYITFGMLYITLEDKIEGTRLANENMLALLATNIKVVLSKESGFKKSNKAYSDFLFICSSLRASLVLMDEDTRDFIKNIILLTITSTMENEKISVNIPNNISINKNLIVQFINSISDAINKSPNKEYNGMVLKRALENVEIDKRIPRYVRIGR